MEIGKCESIPAHSRAFAAVYDKKEHTRLESNPVSLEIGIKNSGLDLNLTRQQTSIESRGGISKAASALFSTCSILSQVLLSVHGMAECSRAAAGWECGRLSRLAVMGKAVESHGRSLAELIEHYMSTHGSVSLCGLASQLWTGFAECSRAVVAMCGCELVD